MEDIIEYGKTWREIRERNKAEQEEKAGDEQVQSTNRLT